MAWAWQHRFDGRRFAWVLVAQVVINLAALPLLRRRLDNRSTDAAPVGLATLYAIVAAPVGLEFDHATVVWCLLAVAVSGAAVWAKPREHAEAKTLAAVAFPMAIVASFGWLWMMADRQPDASPIGNIPFADGAMCTVSWIMLTRMAGAPRVIAFIAAETTFHLVLGIEAFYLLDDGGGRVPVIASTVICALSAGVHFVASFRLQKPQALALAIASYVLFGVAALKLLLVDLHGAGTVVRALAALGIGEIFIVSALAANKLRPEETHGEANVGS